ncbi:GNAT family N-acetyltransferase [Amycolatopsis nigrescens]|uniref:GNAT family N-acetyltransferase n=1 Tax=Amycolatopsis nigrescens TaxID=381445 RepID=UPI000399ABE7|nr:GNAT family N-acetyltransferase [Amycolatopsis nigrescens]
MSDFAIRNLADGEQRSAFALLYQALHRGALTDEHWGRRSPGFLADRRYGAFAEDELIGTAGSFGTELAVPGGALLPTGAVDGVGVRADHTRRGVLSALMGEQLRDLVRRGEVLACLHASETAIYGRFGYGVASLDQRVRITRRAARLHQDAPAGGRVRLLAPEAAVELIPALYRRIAPSRPGMLSRPEVWWPMRFERFRGHDGGHIAAVHTGADGDDGFVVYQVNERHGAQPHTADLTVHDLHAAGPEALAGLWRFLLGMDLVDELHAYRPVDEPVAAMLTDLRAWQVTGVEDESWLRILDVPAALAARTYQRAEPVVLEVSDALLPENSGRYRITADGAERLGDDTEAEVRLGVDVLAMIYLGAWAPSALAATGRLQARTPEAARRADELFGTPVKPWCGTGF